MNERAEDEDEFDTLDPFNNMGARQSVHRNRAQDLMASPAGIKGRSSFLPNAHLELRKVESGEKVSAKKTDRMKMDAALSTPWTQLTQMNHSHFS